MEKKVSKMTHREEYEMGTSINKKKSGERKHPKKKEVGGGGVSDPLHMEGTNTPTLFQSLHSSSFL